MGEIIEQIAVLSPDRLQRLADRLLSRRRTRRGMHANATAVRPQLLPLSFAQEHLWFLHELGLSGSAYNESIALDARGALDIEVLRRSFTEIVRRHESLRTRFVSLDGIASQVIDDPGDFAIAEVDLRHLTSAQMDAQVQRHVEEEAAWPFDLALGPLLRALLIRRADQVCTLIITGHHIVFDGWSAGVIARENHGALHGI
jgi:hypothetical protein